MDDCSAVKSRILAQTSPIQVVVLIEIICRQCYLYFHRCPHHYKNTCYCTDECRNIARAEQCRKAGRKYSNSLRGKLAAAARQARHRMARKSNPPPVPKEEPQEPVSTEPPEIVTHHTKPSGGDALNDESVPSSSGTEREQCNTRSTPVGNLKTCNICGLKAHKVVPLRMYLAERLAKKRKMRFKYDPD